MVVEVEAMATVVVEMAEELLALMATTQIMVDMASLLTEKDMGREAVRQLVDLVELLKHHLVRMEV